MPDTIAASLPRLRPATRRPSLGLVGYGAFGAFAQPHLARFFDVVVHDPGLSARDLPGRAATLAEAAAADIVVLAVPLAALRPVAAALAPLLRQGTLVVDVCSLKAAPLAILTELLPPGTPILGTHPLFGPQSGRHGLAGLRLALCPAPGQAGQARRVARFLRGAFGLEVTTTSAEDHDRQMAYVQGLTHIVSRIVMAMDLPPLALGTTTFGHLTRMVDTVRHDSDALFRTIARDNPHAAEVRARFEQATAQVLAGLAPPAATGATAAAAP